MNKYVTAFIMQIVLIALMLIGVQTVHAKPSGMASWYGKYHHGRLTASGERFNMYGLTAAHKTLPFGTIIRVRNKETGESVRVTINDRGPYVRGRVLDLSYGAAKRLGMDRTGVAKIEYKILVRGKQPYQADTRTRKQFIASVNPTTVKPEIKPDRLELLINEIDDRQIMLAMAR